MSGGRNPTLPKPDALVICCEHHLIAPGKCSSTPLTQHIKLPAELIELILRSYASLGCQHAYNAALVHPSFSKSILKTLTSGNLDYLHWRFNKWETKGLSLQSMDMPKQIGLLRYGYDPTAQGRPPHGAVGDFDPSIDVTDLQCGAVRLKRLRENASVKKLTVLEGHRHVSFGRLAPNVEELSLLNASWTTLHESHYLGKLRVVYFFKLGTDRWPEIFRFKAYDFSDWAIEKLQSKVLERVYMVSIDVKPQMPYCAVEKLLAREEKSVEVGYYRFVCRKEWSAFKKLEVARKAIKRFEEVPVNGGSFASDAGAGLYLSPPDPV